MKKMIPIACDHAGFHLKEYLKVYIESLGFEAEDFGTYSEASVDYPDFARPVCKKTGDGDAELGVLICGTGNGMAMTANKFADIRAALCWNPEIAGLARSHNNANILVLPSRFMSFDIAGECLRTFLDTAFEGGRHSGRIEKMKLVTED
jgi:ribose 5-phosphate isomerase B